MPTNVSFLGTAKKRLSHSFHAFFWHTRPSCTFSFTKVHRCPKLLIPASNAIGRWGITVELSPECPLNRNNWFVLRKLQHTKRLLLRGRHYRFVTREKRGVGLRMRTKLEHLLFHSMWETYFCLRFDSRNGRLKPLQSFWYTLYFELGFFSKNCLKLLFLFGLQLVRCKSYVRTVRHKSECLWFISNVSEDNRLLGCALKAVISTSFTLKPQSIFIKRVLLYKQWLMHVA